MALRPDAARKGSKGDRGPSRQRRANLGAALLIVLAAILVIGGLFGERGLVAMQQARRQEDGLNASIARLRADNARLADQIRRLKDDPRALEEEARRQLGLVRPGETLFIVKDVAKSAK